MTKSNFCETNLITTVQDVYINKLVDLLHKDVCVVRFTKVDGTGREMTCTLREDLIPVTPTKDTTKTRKLNPDVICVWDLENEGWRSFRKDSVITYGIDTVSK